MQQMIEDFFVSDRNTSISLLNDIMYANEVLSIEQVRKMESNLTDGVRSEAMYHMILADVFYYKNVMDSSRLHYEEMLYKAMEARDTIMARHAATNLAGVYAVLGDLTKSIQLSKFYSVKLKVDPLESSTHYYNLGNWYLKLGQLDSATYYIRKSADIDRNIGNEEGLIYALLAVIELHYRAGNYEEALEACEECSTICKQNKELRLLVNCMFLKADALRQMNRNEEALSIIDQAIEIDKKRGDFSRLSLMNLIKGKILIALQNSEAEEYLLKALNLAVDRKDPSDEASSLLTLVRYHTSNGNYNKGREFLKRVEEIIAQFDLARIKREYFEAADQLYIRTNDFRSANKILNERISLLTSDKDELIASQAATIDQSYELFQAERQNERLAYEQEISALEAKRMNNLYLGIAIILLLTSLLWYYAYQNQHNKMAKIEVAAKELELRNNNRLLRKEMDNLRSQMNPHFLFNSLNSINDYVMHEDPKLASIYLTKFSRLMRLILNHSKRELISLEEELQAITIYMELEQIRFKNKFSFVAEIDSSLPLGGVFVPPMLIQPFLENAVKHGMKNLDRPGKIVLKLREEDDKLLISILDNGIGRKASQELRSGLQSKHRSYGQEITAERINMLNSLYDIDAEIKYYDHENPSGTEVLISLMTKKEKITEWKKLEQLS